MIVFWLRVGLGLKSGAEIRKRWCGLVWLGSPLGPLAEYSNPFKGLKDSANESFRYLGFEAALRVHRGPSEVHFGLIWGCRNSVYHFGSRSAFLSRNCSALFARFNCCHQL